MRPDPLDAVRAEGRRLLAKIMNEVEYKDAVSDFVAFMLDHADALLDPTLTEEERGHVEAQRDAALASPEGVVTLPKLGQRVRITTDDGMDHVGEVIRYGDPEGNVRTLFMVALDDGSSGYFLDEPSWHWTLVPHRPEDTKGGDDEAALARMDALVAFTPDPPEDPT